MIHSLANYPLAKPTSVESTGVHPTATDVRTIESENKPEHKLIKTLIRVNSLISTIFQEVYGIRQPINKGIQDLDDAAKRIWADEITTRDLLDMETTDRFIALSQRMACRKMLIILHQPYLRSNQWPQWSRLKVLTASQEYISDFLTGVTDPVLAPYSYILEGEGITAGLGDVESAEVEGVGR
ncbi:hypothetical protein BBP40_010046 [Aspergillus hancockii]|nr:hypothetical protein BBP40_010046 [Aspergillus hancockii]